MLRHFSSLRAHKTHIKTQQLFRWVPTRACCVAFSCIFLLAGLHRRTFAQATDSSSEIRILRTYVDEDKLRSILQLGDYSFVRASELEQLLASRQEQRVQKLIRAPVLREALYVARLQDGVLDSDYSRWTVGGEGLLPLQNITLALKPRRFSDQTAPLLDHLLTRAGGDLSLRVTEQEDQFSFGFTAAAVGETPDSYRLSLPSATQSLMLISAENSVELDSPDIVIEPIVDPTQFLPSDWPTENLLYGSRPNNRWWLAHIGNATRVRLVTNEFAQAAAGTEKTVIRDSTAYYLVKRQSIDLIQDFSLPGGDLPQRIRLQVDPRLHLGAINVNGVPVRWSTVKLGSTESRLHTDHDTIELDLSVLDENALAASVSPALTRPADPPATTLAAQDQSESAEAPSIQSIRVFASLSTADQENQAVVNVPRISIANAHVIHGNSYFLSDDKIVIDRLTGNGVLSRPLDYADLAMADETVARIQQSLSSLPASLVWQCQWTGSAAPGIEIGVSERIDRWKAESLTHFTINPEWLNARCQIRIAANALNTNELMMQVGRLWFVDQVEQVGTPDPGMRIDLLPSEDPDSLSQIRITWTGERKKLDLRLSVEAHRPLAENGERIRRLLTVNRADQVDYYVLEPNGRFRVDVTDRLLGFQRQIFDLPSWQRDLIPDSKERWIFGGLRRIAPPINLTASQGQYFGEVYSILSSDSSRADQKSVSFDINIKPISTSVSHVQVKLPTEYAWDQFSWTVHDGSTTEPIVPTILDETPVYRLAEFELKRAASAPFQIISTQQELAQVTSNAEVALPDLPNAESVDSTVVLPSGLVLGGRSAQALQGLPANVEVIPIASCCSESRVAEILREHSVSPADSDQYLAMSFDAKSVQSLRLTSSSPATDSGWINTELVQHWLDGKQVIHEAHWNLEHVQEQRFALRLPDDWTLVAYEIDGQKQTAPTMLPDGRLELPLPRRNQIEITVRATSTQHSYFPFYRYVLKKPLVEMPVRRTLEVAHIPPTLSSIDLTPPNADPPSGLERLLPRNAWGRISPAPFTNPARDSANQSPGWTTHNLSRSSPDQPLTIRTLPQTALATLLLSAMVVSCCATYVLAKVNWLLGWLNFITFATSIFLAPVAWIGLLQVILLGIAIGLTLALASRFLQSPAVHQQNSRRFHGSTQRNGTVSALAVLCLALQFASTKPVHSQTNTPASEPRTGSTLLPRTSFEEGFYEVLIPMTKDRELAGSFVYVPSELYEQLRSGSESVATSLPTAILSANYSLRIASTNGAANQISEMYAEYTIQIGQDSMGRPARVLLPIRARELPLLGAQINGGLDNTLSPQVVATPQENPEAIQFRPDTPGTYTVRLYFRPMATADADGRVRLLASIPPVTSATLRVTCDPTAQFEVRSLGAQQTLTGTQTIIALGPVDEIDASWIPTVSRTNIGNSASYDSQVFCHTHANDVHLMVVQQINNTGNLPQFLHLNLVDTWELIGTDLGDARIEDSTRSPLSNRRTYTIRLNENILTNGEDATLRMLLVPRRESPNDPPPPLAVPTLQEVTESLPRKMTLVKSAHSWWNVTVPTTWLALTETPTIPPELAPLDLAAPISETTGQSYLASQDFAAKLIRAERTSTESQVAERYVYRLGLLEVQTQYNARWDEQPGRRDLLRVRLPPGTRVDDCRINNFPTNYELVKRGDQNWLLIHPAVGSETSFLDIELTQSVRPGQPFRIHRLELDQANVASSSLRVFRANGIRCNIQYDDPGFRLGDALVRPTELLVNREALVGEAELTPAIPTELPMQLEITFEPRTDHEPPVVRILKEAGRWEARFEIDWRDSDNWDYVILDVPASLANALESETLYDVRESGEVGRSFVTFMPAEDSERQITARFPLQVSPLHQRINLPRIRVLSGGVQYPLIALPDVVDDELATWSTTLEQVETISADSTAGDAAFRFFQSLDAQSLLSWSLDTQRSTQLRLLSAKYVIERTSDTRLEGFVEYWLQPNGDVSVDLTAPENMQIVGARIGHEAVRLFRKGDREFEVLLQPNYSTICLRVFVAWSNDTQGSTFELRPVQIGQPNQQNVPEQSLLQIATPAWKLLPTNVDATPFNTASHWHSTLLTSAYETRGFSKAEKVAWLSGWRPALFGLAALTPVDDSTSLNAATPDDAVTPKLVQDAWVEAVELLGLEQGDFSWSDASVFWEDNNGQAGDSDVILPFSAPTGPVETLPNEWPVLLSNTHRQTATPVEYQSAILVGATLSLLAIVFAFVRGRLTAFLDRQAWIFWTLLAVLLLALLPVSWPAVIIFIAAIAIAIGHWLDHRRMLRYG